MLSIAAGVLLACLPAAALAGPLDDPANQWLPRSDNASWTYAWSNSTYQPAPRREKYTVTARAGTSFRLRWDEIDPPATETPSSGTIDFQHTDTGLVNTNYSSSQPPPRFPILCASATECASSLSAAWYMVIWGTRSPVFAEPMLDRDALELARRGQQRRRLEQPLPRAREGQGAGVPGRDRGRAGRLRRDPGGRDRRSVRDADPHRLLGLRRRAGARRPAPRER